MKYILAPEEWFDVIYSIRKLKNKRRYVGKQNFIEINGRKYDVITGKLIQGSNGNSQKTPKTTALKKNIGIVDGIIRAKPHKAVKRSKPSHIGIKPQKSRTLMRKSVVKPSIPKNKAKKSPKQNFLKGRLGISSKRAQHANLVHRSASIKKYGDTSSNSGSIQETSTTRTTASSVKSKQEPHITQHKTSVVNTIIDRAMENSNSHLQPPAHHKHKKQHKIIRKLGISTKAAAMSSAVLAGVLLGGFFAMQKVPSLAMKVAATRAGFDATMPGYKPSGFRFKGPINYSAGRVTVSFQSNTDNRAYNLTEKSSNWNSDALLSNFVLAENKQYQTYQDRGRTLYIYDGSNATWVDNGIWYQVEGESNMTTDQIIRIASSI